MRTAHIKVRDGAAVWREIDDETIILALELSRYLGLNRTGTRLWPMLVDGTTRAAMAEHLVAAFGVSEQRAVVDIDAFVARCQQHNLLEG